jgi:hypothetical protein
MFLEKYNSGIIDQAVWSKAINSIFSSKDESLNDNVEFQKLEGEISSEEKLVKDLENLKLNKETEGFDAEKKAEEYQIEADVSRVFVISLRSSFK